MSKKKTEIIPITDLRQDGTRFVKGFGKSRGPLVTTQWGRADGVMLSIEDIGRSQEDRDLLRALARGDREIRAGRGFALDSVLADADGILKKS